MSGYRFLDPLCDLSESLFLVIDPRDQVVECSSVWRESLSLPCKLSDLIHPDDQKILNSVLDSSAAKKAELRLVFSKVGVRWFSVLSSPYIKENHKIIALQSCDHQKISVSFLSEIGKGAKIGFWDMDLHTSQIFWSEAMYSIFDLHPEEYKPDLNSIYHFLGAESLDKFSQTYKSVIETGDFYSGDLKVLTAKGRQAWVRVYVYGEKRDNKITRIYGLCLDVSKEKMSQRESYLINQRLELALSVIEQGVWEWTPKKGKFSADKNLLKVMSLPEDTILNSYDQFQSYIQEEDAWRVYEELKDAFSQNKKSFETEYRIESPIEGVKHISSACRIFYDDQGQPEKILGVNWDVTTQRQQEMKLLESTKFAVLGEMAGGIAHEVNNPLTIIKGKADQLLVAKRSQKLQSDKLEEGLIKISETVDRIAKIIRGLKAFSRNASKDPMQIVDIQRVVDDALDLCSEKFKVNGVQLSAKITPGLSIKCRPVQISQVILNLLSNAFDAIKYSDEAWVFIEAVASGGAVVLSVTDSGRGIAPSIVNRMMQPFFTTKEVGEGTGLGLSISQGLILDHGGKLYYDSQSQNTRFVVRLPAVVSRSQGMAS